jgi:hypothetical protein
MFKASPGGKLGTGGAEVDAADPHAMKEHAALARASATGSSRGPGSTILLAEAYPALER